VAGGGFAGVETVAALNDFVREALPFYPNLCEDMLRVMLVHSGSVILPELGESLGEYTQEVLARRGVEVQLNTRVKSMRKTAYCWSIVPRFHPALWFGLPEQCLTP
jgi:NADH dehydrogenase